MTDVYGPRLTNSPNYRAASEWAISKLGEWGLQDARLESWGPFGRGWSLEGLSVSITKPHYTPVIATPKAWSPSTKGTIKRNVIYLDAPTEADLARYKGKLKDAIVLLSPPVEVRAHFEAKARRLSDEQLLSMANAEPPSESDRRFRATPEQRAMQALAMKKLQLAIQEGAAVTLEPSARGGDGGILFVGSAGTLQPSDPESGRRQTPWSREAPATVPQLVVATEHYNRIIRMLARNTPVEMEVKITSRFHDDDIMGYNVIAEIPGTDLRDEIVMVGAHYDSWHAGTGATDNASGSAVCMEAVRIIQSLGLKPRRTIRIALWGGEEQGLLGSRAYVAKHFGRRVDNSADGSSRQRSEIQFELTPDHDKFSAYFNLDNGTGKIRGVYLQGNEAVRPIFRAWLSPFRDLDASTLTISNTRGTDHLSFDAVGLPGFQFIQDPIEYSTRTHHTNMDVYDRIQEEDLKQSSIIMATFAYNAAVRDEKLPRKPLPGRRSPASDPVSTSR
jgi:hypothetical protein